MYNIRMRNAVFTDKSSQEKRIATRVRSIHMIILAAILVLVAGVTAFIVTDITNNVSQRFVRLYAVETIEKFNTYVNQELVLTRKASHSPAIINWFADEENPVKRNAAFEKLRDYRAILQDTMLYFGLHKSLNEYFLSDDETSFADFIPLASLDPGNAADDWYFNCIKSSHEYTFNVDSDKATGMWHIWINYKIMENDNLMGVLRFGLPFDKLSQNLFAQHDSADVRGYIIDRYGVIQIDSVQSDIYFEGRAGGRDRIYTISSDLMFHSAVDKYLEDIDRYFEPSLQPIVLKLSNDSHRYVSIAPIINTDWSVVMFFNNNSLYHITNLFPLLMVMLSAFLLYALLDGIFIQRLVFTPLNRLTRSLSASKFYIGEIFGYERNDEIGILAQTIQKMRDRLSTYNAELLRAAREREHLIRIDQLTDIPNRRSFDERLPLEWGRAVRTKTPIAILILDLDHFKNYNDTYGHLQGDKALQEVAKLFMQELKRSGDLVARWGGEEFAILLANTDFEGAFDVAERIRLKVENLQILLSDGSVSKITVSAGVNSLIPTANDVLEDFIRHADMALYTAKREGRNKACRYNGIHLNYVVGK